MLAYQAWTYWVFRKRIGRGSIPTSRSTARHAARPVTRTTDTAVRYPFGAPTARPLDPRLLRHSRSSRPFLLACVLLGLLGAAAVLGQAVLLATMITAVFLDGADLAAIGPTSCCSPGWSCCAPS